MTRLYVSNRDESVRIFTRDALERFTYVHPAVPHLLYWPVVAYLLWAEVGDAAMAAGRAASLMAAGFVLWTLTEYAVHRFVFHATADVEARVRANVTQLRAGQSALSALRGWRERFYFLAHGVHHDFPNDSRRLVMPPSVSVPLAVLFWWTFGLAFGGRAPLVFAGFLIGYIVYDTIHFATHHVRPRTAVGRYLKKHHFRHHYDDPNRNFGVSTPLWDLAFRTIGSRSRRRAA